MFSAVKGLILSHFKPDFETEIPTKRAVNLSENYCARAENEINLYDGLNGNEVNEDEDEEYTEDDE